MAEYQFAALEKVRKPAPETRQPERAERHDPHPIVRLQSQLGNRAVARMVQRAAEEDELQAKHDTSLQRESEGGEMEEEELQARHDTSLQRESEGGEMEEEELQASHDRSLQRESEGGEMEEEELQARHDTSPVVGLEGGPVGEGIQQSVNSARGGGSSAPSSIVQKMEAATGADLSGVRVHEGKEADSLNRQLTAKAFTTGSDIFLRSDQSTGDSHLMAHELAHVVQQSSGRTASTGGMSVGAANDPLEHEADDLANRVLSGAAQREAEETKV